MRASAFVDASGKPGAALKCSMRAIDGYAGSVDVSWEAEGYAGSIVRNVPIMYFKD